MANDPTIRKFVKAADQRLAAGEFLLSKQAFRLEAMYLCGYCVEIALKTVILVHDPASKRDETLASFRGSTGTATTGCKTN